MTPPFETLDPWIRVLAARWHIPGMDNDDVLQEARLAVVKGLPAYNPKRGAATTFVARVVHNHLQKRLRAAAAPIRNAPTLSLDSTDMVVAVSHATPFDVAAAREALRVVVLAVRELEPRQRMVLAADLNDEPLSTADRSAVKRARAKLREAA